MHGYGLIGPPYRNRRVRFGLNYTPSKNWWYSWGDWDAGSIRRDLANISSIGMDHIRIMLIWPDLQPNATYVRAEMVQRLVEMLDMAGEAGLDVEATVFNGQVSGFLFTTPWLINGGNGQVANLYTDAGAIASEQALRAALAAEAAKHPRFLGFDLDSIRNMASCSGLWGITWWCSHEVSTRFTGFNPLEYDLGVFTNDRVLKPIGATIQRLAAEFDKTPPQPLARPEALVLPDDMVPWTGFFEPYMNLIKQGVRPAVVLQSRTGDASYLQARGITKLIYLSQVS